MTATTARLAFFSAALIAPSLGAAINANAETISIVASRDNTLFHDPAGAVSNGIGPVFFVGANSQGNVRRGVLRFDVAAAVPANAVVDSVRLTLHLSNATNAIPRSVALHRMLADWGEGSSSASGGSGAASTSGDATWLHAFKPDVLWQNAGGDFAPGASDSTQVNQPGFYSWSGPGLAADVRLWLGGAPNFGWLLQGDEATPSSARRFDSREHATEEFRPVLTIHFTPDVPVLPATWGSIKAYRGSSTR
jgi:hypothetical protein